MRSKVAWLLGALTVALTAVDIAVTSAYRTMLSEEAIAQHGFPFANGAVVGSALLGAVILSRDGRHVIGWLLSLVGPGGCAVLDARGLQHLGGQRGRPRAAGSGLGPRPGLGADRRPVRDRHAGPAVPAGTRRATALAAVAVRRRRGAAGRAVLRHRAAVRGPDDVRHRGCGRRSGPRADLHRRVRPDQCRPRRRADLDAGAPAPKPRRGAAADGRHRRSPRASWPSVSVRSSSYRASTAAGRAGPRRCRCTSPTFPYRCCSRWRCCATGSTTSA